MQPILKLSVGDTLKLKKPHPCGGNVFRVMRVGSEVRIICQTCGRDMTIDRIKLEHAVKKITTAQTEESEETKKHE